MNLKRICARAADHFCEGRVEHSVDGRGKEHSELSLVCCYPGDFVRLIAGVKERRQSLAIRIVVTGELVRCGACVEDASHASPAIFSILSRLSGCNG